MDWKQVLFQVIDFGSFSSVWYWIVLAVLWSSVSYYVLGVPFDLIMKAKRQRGQIEADMVDLVRINVNRLLGIAQTTGTVLIIFVCFVLTSLGLLAFVYDIELAQAVFLIALPLSLVGVLSLHSARKIRNADPEPEQLYALLMRHRLWTQIIGMVSIFVTAMFGMVTLLSMLRMF